MSEGSAPTGKSDAQSAGPSVTLARADTRTGEVREPSSQVPLTVARCPSSTVASCRPWQRSPGRWTPSVWTPMHCSPSPRSTWLSETPSYRKHRRARQEHLDPAPQRRDARRGARVRRGHAHPPRVRRRSVRDGRQRPA
jgi:hypothetical protein